MKRNMKRVLKKQQDNYWTYGKYSLIRVALGIKIYHEQGHRVGMYDTLREAMEHIDYDLKQ